MQTDDFRSNKFRYFLFSQIRFLNGEIKNLESYFQRNKISKKVD